MTVIITEDCINCGACAFECPLDAIFEPNEGWMFNDIYFKPLSMDHFFISPTICDECSQLNEIKCILVCPIDAIKRLNIGEIL